MKTNEQSEDEGAMPGRRSKANIEEQGGDVGARRRRGSKAKTEEQGEGKEQ